MFKPAGTNSELIGLIASQLPEEMDMSAWSGDQGEKVAKGGGMAPAPGVPKWMQQAHDVLFGQPKYERRLTPEQRQKLVGLEADKAMGLQLNDPADKMRVDLGVQEYKNRLMNQKYNKGR